MKTATPAPLAENVEVFGGFLPKIVYYSSHFPMKEWEDLIRQSGYSVRCVQSLYEIHAAPETLSVVLLDGHLTGEKELLHLEETCRDGAPLSFVSLVSSAGNGELPG